MIETRWIWWDGELVEAERAAVPFLTPALHYGIGVFEGIRCYATADGPAVFRLREHVARLLASARCLGFLALPWDEQEIAAAIVRTIEANALEQCYVRPLAWLADEGWDLSVDRGRLRLAIAVWPWADYHGSHDRGLGIRAHVSSFTRHHPNATATKAKISGNYVNSVLAKTESLRLGFDEAIMLDPEGYVAECTGANLFIARGGTLYTPPPATILEGFTRDSLMVLAGDLGVPVVEARLSRDQLWLADEVFACGTAAECVAIREVDHRTIGAGTAGPITRSLQRAYDDAVHGRHPRSAGWCHPLAPPRATARTG